MQRRATVVGAVMLALCGFIPAAQARSLDDIIKSGTVRIGVAANQPPSSSLGPNNTYQGFDIDIGNRIAQALGVKAQFVPVESPDRIPFLLADRVDLICAELTRNAEREKVVDFTVPLHTEAMSVLTTDKVPIKSWKDLNNPKYTVVDQRGNNSVDFLKKNLPEAKLLIVETLADMVRAVAQGRADAIVENIDFYLGTTKSYPDVKWRVLPDVIMVAYDGIGVQRGNDGLRHFLNEMIFEMQSGGFVNGTWTKWYGAPPVVPVVPNPYF